MTGQACLLKPHPLGPENWLFNASLNITNLSRVVENEVLCSIEEGYNIAITGMNRGITVGIAVYRYILVFYPHTNIGEYAQKNLRKKIVGIIFGTEA